jgi:hypothetical protein
VAAAVVLHALTHVYVHLLMYMHICTCVYVCPGALDEASACVPALHNVLICKVCFVFGLLSALAYKATLCKCRWAVVFVACLFVCVLAVALLFFSAF